MRKYLQIESLVIFEIILNFTLKHACEFIWHYLLTRFFVIQMESLFTRNMEKATELMSIAQFNPFISLPLGICGCFSTTHLLHPLPYADILISNKHIFLRTKKKSFYHEMEMKMKSKERERDRELKCLMLEWTMKANQIRQQHLLV